MVSVSFSHRLPAMRQSPTQGQADGGASPALAALLQDIAAGTGSPGAAGNGASLAGKPYIDLVKYVV